MTNSIKTKCLQQLYLAAMYKLKAAKSPGYLDNVELKLGSKSKIVNLKILTMYIIKDNQSSITICGCIVNCAKY